MNLLHLSNRCRIFILTGLCFVLGASIALSSGSTPSKQARSTYSFVDFLGIGIHLSYRDTAYSKYDEIIKPRLQELGIHHIRDDVRFEDIDTQKKLVDLAKSGIKSTLVMDPRAQHTGSRAVNIIKSMPISVEAVEGPNEWELQPMPEDEKQSFFKVLQQFQTELYSAIKGDPNTSSIPVLSPSIHEEQKAPEIGRLPCDFFNIHNYPLGKWGMPLDDLDNKLNVNKIICANKPVIVTEAGYSTSHGNYDNYNKYAMPDQVAVKYLLRLLLEYFNREIKRVYIYELIDWNSDLQGDKWGLLRYDGSPKPGFIALKNLISLLQDPHARTSDPFPLKSIDYNLQGDTTDIHHTLLQKSNGNFYLILWQEVPSFEHQTKTNIVVPERSLILTLNTPISQASTYQPVNSITPFEQYNNVKQLNLKVPDHPLIIKLVPD